MAITSPKAPICPLLTHSASGILASTTHTRTCAWAQWTGTEMITPKVWYLKALRPAKAVMPRPPGALAKLSAVPRPLLQNCFVPGGLGGLSKGGVNCVCCVSPLCVCHAGALPRGDESVYCIPPCTSPAWGVLPACPPRDLGQPGRCRELSEAQPAAQGREQPQMLPELQLRASQTHCSRWQTTKASRGCEEAR